MQVFEQQQNLDFFFEEVKCLTIFIMVNVQQIRNSILWLDLQFTVF